MVKAWIGFNKKRERERKNGKKRQREVIKILNEGIYCHIDNRLTLKKTILHKRNSLDIQAQFYTPAVIS